MVAHLTRLLGPANLDLAADAVQEAMLKALQTWPYQGIPENPAGWLFRAAHNLAIDSIRRKQTFGKRPTPSPPSFPAAKPSKSTIRECRSSCATTSSA